MDIKSLPQGVRTYLKSTANVNSVSQCVTELVLNSLDAKSTSVAVRVNLITFRVQAVDNGAGITQSNMNLSGIRYMTSKCQSLEDLKKIKWFGFRGEALASICGMSRKVTVESRHKDVERTFSKTYENENWGEVESVKLRPTQGTTVTVEGFMHNLPVRRKRINQNLDLREIKENLEALALIHPKVSFNLRDDITGKIVFQISKTHTVSHALASLCPDISIDDLLVLKVSKNKTSVSGLIYNKPSPNKKLQFIYLNKRPINSPKIQSLLHSLLTKSRIFWKSSGTEEHAVYVINIHCSYSQIDLMLSPSKKSVEFKHWDVVLKCIEKAVVGCLEQEGLIDVAQIAQEDGQPTAACFPSQFGVSQIQGAVKSVLVKRKIIEAEESLMETPEASSLSASGGGNQILVSVEVHSSGEARKRNKAELNKRTNQGLPVLDDLKSSQPDKRKDSPDDDFVTKTKRPKPQIKLFKTLLGNPNHQQDNHGQITAKPRPKRRRPDLKLSNNRGIDSSKIEIAPTPSYNQTLNKFKKPNCKATPKTALKTCFKISDCNLETSIVDAENIKPTSLFEKHTNTQSLVLNSDCVTIPDSPHPLLNSTIDTNILENQEKGKEIIMDMFLKSSVVFPNKQSEIEPKLVQTVVVETSKQNTMCQNHNATFTVSLKLKSRKTIFTNSVLPAHNLNDLTIDDENLTTKDKPSGLPEMTSKYIQTTMVEQQKEVNFNLFQPAQMHSNMDVTFSKFFKSRPEPAVTKPPYHDHHLSDAFIGNWGEKPHLSKLPTDFEKDDFNFTIQLIHDNGNRRREHQPIFDFGNQTNKYFQAPNYPNINEFYQPSCNLPSNYRDHLASNTNFQHSNRFNNQDFNLPSREYWNQPKRLNNYWAEPISTARDCTIPLYRRYNPRKFENNYFNHLNHQPQNIYFGDCGGKRPTENGFHHITSRRNSTQRFQDVKIGNDAAMNGNMTKFTFNSHLNCNNQDVFKTKHPRLTEKFYQRVVVDDRVDNKWLLNNQRSRGNTRFSPKLFAQKLDKVFLQSMPAKVGLGRHNISQYRQTFDGYQLGAPAMVNSVEDRCYSPYFQSKQQEPKPPTNNCHQPPKYYDHKQQWNRMKNIDKELQAPCVSPFFYKSSKHYPVNKPRGMTKQQDQPIPVHTLQPSSRHPETFGQNSWFNPQEGNAFERYTNQESLHQQPEEHGQRHKSNPHNYQLFCRNPSRSDHQQIDSILKQKQDCSKCVPGQRNAFVAKECNQPRQFVIQHKQTNTQRNGKGDWLQEKILASECNKKTNEKGIQTSFPPKIPTTKSGVQDTWLFVPPYRSSKINHISKLSLKKFGTEPIQQKPQIEDFLQAISDNNSNPKRKSFSQNIQSKFHRKKFCSEPFNKPLFEFESTDHPASVKFDFFPPPPVFKDLDFEVDKATQVDFTTPNINKSSTVNSIVEKINLISPDTFDAKTVNTSLCSKYFKPKLSSTRLEDVLEETPRNCYRNNCFSPDVVEPTVTSLNYFPNLPSLPQPNHELSNENHLMFTQETSCSAQVDVSDLLRKCKLLNSTRAKSGQSTYQTYRDTMSKQNLSVLNISISAVKKSQLIQKDFSEECRMNSSENEPIEFTNSTNNPKQALNNFIDSNKNSDSLQKAPEWVPMLNSFGNRFYLHTRTGMTSTCSPKQDFGFDFTKRYEFLPKGLSPILVESKNVDVSLSPNSKKSLCAAIMEGYENELHTIKWLNYIDNYQDANQFFEEMYREKTKQFEWAIPNATVSELPRSALRSCYNLHAQSFSKDIFSDLQVIGQLDNKFIVTFLKSKRLIILFDQHAVHERVRVEDLLAGYKEIKNDTARFKSTKCDENVVVGLSEPDLNILADFKSVFTDLGLYFIIQGDRIEITHIPTCVYNKYVKNDKQTKDVCVTKMLTSLIHELITSIASTRGAISNTPTVIQNVINLEACRGAIKFGDKLKIDECIQHLSALVECKLPFQCAHGRPTLVPIVTLKDRFEMKNTRPNLSKLKD